MKDTLIINGEIYDKLTAVCNLYQVSLGTAHNWRRKGWLGQPMPVGRTHYYMRDVLAKNLTGQKNRIEER